MKLVLSGILIILVSCKTKSKPSNAELNETTVESTVDGRTIKSVKDGDLKIVEFATSPKSPTGRWLEPFAGVLFVEVWSVTKERKWFFDSSERKFYYVKDTDQNRKLINQFKDNDQYKLKGIKIFEKDPVAIDWWWRASRPELFRSGMTTWKKETSYFDNISAIEYLDPKGNIKTLDTEVVYKVEMQAR